MTKLKNAVGKTLAALGVAGLAFTGLAGVAFAAGAPGQSGAETEGTLTIHKYAGDAGDFTGDGSEQTITGKSPLAGVVFTAYPVTGIDVNVQGDWAKISELDFSCDPVSVSGVTGVGVGTGVVFDETNAAGSASETLPLGAYLVCETTPPVNLEEDGGSAPFIVTIPMPNGEDGWRYNVHAYPKNVLVEGQNVKTIDDGDAVTEGDTVSFTVTSKNQNAPVTSFVMIDQIDSLLTYTGNSIEITAILPDGTSQDVTSWFTVTHDAGLLTATAKAGADGINLLNALAAGYKVEFAFDVTVNDGSVGIIENKASVNGVDTNAVTTSWGNIEITKVDQESGALLDGAEFAIYAGECSAVEDTTDAVVEGLTTEDGVITSPSLKDGTYCVVETEAPAGYVDPTWSDTVIVAAGETTSTTAITVENAQQEVPGLPITGAAGTLALTIGGVALLLVGGGLALAARNRKTSV